MNWMMLIAVRDAHRIIAAGNLLVRGMRRTTLAVAKSCLAQVEKLELPLVLTLRLVRQLLDAIEGHLLGQ